MPQLNKHPTIGDIVSSRYLKVMFKIPKKGHAPTPVFDYRRAMPFFMPRFTPSHSGLECLRMQMRTTPDAFIWLQYFSVWESTTRNSAIFRMGWCGMSKDEHLDTPAMWSEQQCTCTRVLTHTQIPICLSWFFSMSTCFISSNSICVAPCSTKQVLLQNI